MTAGGVATVSLWSLWKAEREVLPSFGAVCRMARNGDLPGAVPVSCGTPVILESRISEALNAMKGQTDGQ